MPTPTADRFEAVDLLLPQGIVTIARSFSVTYLKPTFLGMMITVLATLVEIDQKRLVFEITAFDEWAPNQSGQARAADCQWGIFHADSPQEVRPDQENRKIAPDASDG